MYTSVQFTKSVSSITLLNILMNLKWYAVKQMTFPIYKHRIHMISEITHAYTQFEYIELHLDEMRSSQKTQIDTTIDAIAICAAL